MRYLIPLTYVEMIAKTGSIRSAAEHLSITSSALNRRILAIEEELGVNLFERHSNGVTLNLAGELFVQYIRSQKADLERVRSRIADIQGVRFGHIRIAASWAVTRYFLPDKISNYRNQFPGVTFEVQTLKRSEAETALAEQEVDIIITLEPDRLSEFQILILEQQSVQCVVGRGHPLAGHKSVGLLECLEYDLLLSPRGEGIREKLENATSRKGLRLKPSVESNDSALLEGLVKEGVGITFSISVDLPSKNDQTDLVTIPVKSRDIVPPVLFVGQKRDRVLPVASGKFVEELRKSLET